MSTLPAPVTTPGDTGAGAAGEAGCLRARILAAAEAAFVAQGFHATTMDAIARAAHCSKKTVYKLFESKEELFTTLLGALRSEVEALSVPAGADPEEALRSFLVAMAGVVLRDRSVILMRIAMAEAGHIPPAGPGPRGAESDVARLGLERYLAALAQRGTHDFGPPHEAARMLIGMALGAFHHELLSGLKAEVPEADLRARIARSVRIFLHGSRHAT